MRAGLNKEELPSMRAPAMPFLAASGAPPAGEALSRYQFRLLTPAEVTLLNDLYNRCYRLNRSLAEAEWLYRDNPYGEAIIWGAFSADGRLVGVRPAVPWRFFWRGQERKAYLFVDALVAPECRKQGLFNHLLKLVGALSEKEHFSLYSFPNQNSLPIYQKTPLLELLGGCEVQVRILSWLNYVRYKLGGDRQEAPESVPALASLSEGEVSLVPVERFQSDFEDIHLELGKQVASFTLRRREFLNWRYFGSPARTYRVALIRDSRRTHGYLVVRMLHHIVHVIDVFLRPEKPIVRQAFRLLTRWAKPLGASAIYFNSSQGNFFQHGFPQSGLFLRKRNGALILDRKTAHELAVREGRPLAIGDCYFTMGDFDFF